tara:strand:- start:154 stop:360 length:207 start_codon:yes stop_codon:yes gene_type:complete
MRNTEIDKKNKSNLEYFGNGKSFKQIKSSNINVLLNRIEDNQKSEYRKKLYFSAAASAGLVLFGFIIF